MTKMHYHGHAKDVVARFQRMLSQEQKDVIGEEHFEELEMLVSAALGVVHSEQSHRAAKLLEEYAHELRRQSSEVD